MVSEAVVSGSIPDGTTFGYGSVIYLPWAYDAWGLRMDKAVGDFQLYRQDGSQSDLANQYRLSFLKPKP